MQAGQQLAQRGGVVQRLGQAVAVGAVGPGQDRVDRAVDDDHAVVAGADRCRYGQAEAGQRRGGAVLAAGRGGIDVEDLLDRPLAERRARS